MIKNKILMGLGTISAAAIPALAVVSCGSDKTNTTNADASKALTGKKFLDTVTKSKIETFLATFAKAGTSATDGSFVAKNSITIQQYNDAATAAGHKEVFDEILKLNKNDPTLAIYVINFTYKTIAYIDLAFLGLAAANGPDEILKKDKVTATDQILNGPLDAKTIADSIMVKFTIASTKPDGTRVSADPIWGELVFTNYENRNGVLTEINTSMVTTMGGVAGVEAIVTSAGYQYQAKTSI